MPLRVQFCLLLDLEWEQFHLLTGFKHIAPYLSSTSTYHKHVRTQTFFSALPKPFCFPSCVCSLLMWPFDERLQNWVETHWFSSLRPRSIRGGRCIFKDAGETIDNGSGFYVRRFLKTWVVAWQTLNNMVIRTHTHTHNSSVFTSTLLNAGYILVHPHRGQVLQSRPKEEVQDLLQTFPSRFSA